MDSNKRTRNDDGVEESFDSSPDVKRIRADLFEILESEPDKDGSDQDPAVDDLDSVMRSFEEEIATALPSDPDPVPVSTPDLSPHQPDLGFLLEASDDELGLPPPEISGGGVAEVAGDDRGEPAEAAGFGKVWGPEEFHLDFGIGSTDDNGVSFDGGMFEFDDGDFGASDFSDLTWRPEFLPAV